MGSLGESRSRSRPLLRTGLYVYIFSDRYFFTGKMDEALYDSECEFADPFVSFRGRQRFVDNLANLAGGFIEEVSARPLSTTRALEGDSPTYATKLLVKLRLALPFLHTTHPRPLSRAAPLGSWTMKACSGIARHRTNALDPLRWALLGYVGGSPCSRGPGRKTRDENQFETNAKPC